MQRRGEETNICKARGEASEEINPENTLISDYLSPELRKYILLFKSTGLWYFVLAALANWDAFVIQEHHPCKCRTTGKEPIR